MTGKVRRGLAIVVVAVTVFSLAAAMSLAYRGGIVSLNAVGMLQHPLQSDFALYYRDSEVALQSPQHDPYDLATFRRVTAQLGIKRLKADPVVPSLSLPPLIWLVMPFTLLPLAAARWLWLGLLASCLVIVWALAAPGKGLTKTAHLAAAAIFLPVSFAFADGQAILLVTAVVAMSWWLLKRDHEIWAGLVLALLVLKPQLASFVPLALLVAGRWKTFLSFVGGISVVGIAALLTVPWHSLLQYAARVSQASGDPDMWRVNTNLTAASQGGAIVGLIESLLAAGIAILAIRRLKQQTARDDIAVVCGLLVSLLTTPYVHYPDLTILVLGAWIFLRTARQAWQKWLLFVGYAVVTLEQFGLPLTRTVEMAWLVSFVVTSSPKPTWLAVRSAFRRPNVEASRVA